QTFTVPLLPDHFAEGSEDLRLHLHNVTATGTGVWAELGQPYRATLTIHDADTTYTYNGDQLTQEAYPDSTARSWTSAPTSGMVQTYTDERGAVWTFTYDANGNRATESNPLGQVTSYTYNAQNQVATRTTPDPDGAGPLTAPVTTFAYDASDLHRL